MPSVERVSPTKYAVLAGALVKAMEVISSLKMRRVLERVR